MPRVDPDKKEVCPSCNQKFKSVIEHLANPSTSCRPWFGDLISISETLAKQLTKQTLPPSVPLSPSLPDNEMPLSDYEDSSFMPMDFEMGNTSPPLGGGMQKDGYFVTMHPNTPLVKEGGKTFMDKFDSDQFADQRRQNLYYPFANRDDWEMAYWLLNSGLSMVAINKFLSLKLVS